MGFNSYYKSFLKDENFLSLKNEIDAFLDPPQKLNCENFDNMKVILNLKQDNQTKRIEINHVVAAHSQEKPSILIAEQIIKDLKIDNIKEANYEEFIKLLYSIKFRKLENQNKKEFQFLSSFYLLGLRDQFTWNAEPNLKDYQGSESLNFDHLTILLFVSTQYIDDENKLVNLLKSLCYNNLLSSDISGKIRANKLKEFISFFLNKIVDIAKKVESIHSKNPEILSLIFEALIYPSIQCFSSSSSEIDIDILFPIHIYVEEFFNKYFVFNEQLQKDPIFFLSTPYFMRLSRYLLSVFENPIFEKIQNKNYFHDEISKIFLKVYEILIFNTNNIEEIVHKYPQILVMEGFYDDITGLLKNAKLTKKEENHNLFQGIFQRILNKVKNAKSPKTFDFY